MHIEASQGADGECICVWVGAYHGVWLQQLENGRAEWQDADLKLEYRWALVWNSARPDIPTLLTSAAPWQNETKDTPSKPVPAPAGIPDCVLFNQGKCEAQAAHPSECHICTYCLHMVNHVCMHQERFHRCKVYDQAAKD